MHSAPTRSRHGAVPTEQGIWVFGYASLMSRADFEDVEAVHARVDGWRRGFFIYSTHHRGNEQGPGLVLALGSLSGGRAPYRDLKRRSSFSSTDFSLVDEDEQEEITKEHQQRKVVVAVAV